MVTAEKDYVTKEYGTQQPPAHIPRKKDDLQNGECFSKNTQCFTMYLLFSSSIWITPLLMIITILLPKLLNDDWLF